MPARTLTGDVEWPRHGGAPEFLRREGDEHRYCPLALVTVDGSGALQVTSDCRPLFTALTAQTHLHLSSGDGQEVMPPPGGGLAKLPQQLEVAVVNGRRAVNGATVRFTALDANDRVGTTALTTQAVATAGGLAACDWWLGTAAAGHRVAVELLDQDGDPVGPPLHFDASFSLASEVAYSPTCDVLAEAGTVQLATTTLAKLPRLYHVTGDGSHASPGEVVVLAVGVASDCGPDLEARPVRFLVREGNGQLEGTEDGVVVTDDGTAQCSYNMGDKPAPRRHRSQAARGGSDKTFEPPVFFDHACAGGRPRADAEAADIRPDPECLNNAEDLPASGRSKAGGHKAPRDSRRGSRAQSARPAARVR